MEQHDRIPGMRCFSHFPFRIFFILTCTSWLSAACQNQQSRFTGTSQANLVTDTIEGSSGRTPTALEGGGMPEGVGHSNGHFYAVRNGQATLLSQRQRFPQGLTFDGGHRIILRNGSVVVLSEGEMITFVGERIPLPPGTRMPTP
jgi:hypothetical protein